METTYMLSETARELGIPGIGRNLIYQILRKMGIVDDDNRPAKKYIDEGLLAQRSPRYSDGDSLYIIPVTVVVGDRGLNFLRKTIEEYLKTHRRPKVSHPTKRLMWVGYIDEEDYWCRD